MGLYVNSKYVSMVFIFCSACDCWAVFRIFVPGCHEVNGIFREAVMRKVLCGIYTALKHFYGVFCWQGFITVESFSLCRVKRSKLVTLCASAALFHHGLICLTFFPAGIWQGRKRITKGNTVMQLKLHWKFGNILKHLLQAVVFGSSY